MPEVQSGEWLQVDDVGMAVACAQRATHFANAPSAEQTGFKRFIPASLSLLLDEVKCGVVVAPSLLIRDAIGVYARSEIPSGSIISYGASVEGVWVEEDPKQNYKKSSCFRKGLVRRKLKKGGVVIQMKMQIPIV